MSDDLLWNRSILIAEDDPEQLATLQRWFNRSGYQAIGVHHPRLALAAAELRPFQVAIVNYSLPELDGLELMRQLQRRISEIPVVILSYDAETVDDAKFAGAFDCLLKPYAKSQLEAVVRKAFEQTRTRVPVGT